ncbi:YlxR family protein [Mycoplasmopsis agalactiae]|uniref:YlxR domain-containing protein n=1 Tax=Mycoplasmopsis agalactiae (strain NCTC 10123 / CIP 59.7 / PG2) TaxID=347257 RepID=A5IZD9_MYCAP|nr:YlxR family protein [Mycoplasmopsis agalactiae]CAL59398.1 Conserved hypothetical protein [Mycoplasmopsis agalactiae PG2]MCE6057414.1 YlxR family protein [Mycoplasmopsis agalactiae]MCE6062030.1 YlxR family protein [Mycoplasmopsis agalactiae]MCE6079192.1 YlxR family protein [Mycoplasmopsis agalactiae]
MTLKMKSDKKNEGFSRKCIATGLIVPENQMLRFDYNKNENLIKLDVNRELKGRGAYFIATEENWNTVVRKKCLNKTFRTAVPKEVYERIEAELKEGKWLKRID